MEIVDVLVINNRLVVVGGDPGAANISDHALQGLRDKLVMLTTAQGKSVEAHIRELTISRSLIGQRNIMLGCSIDPDIGAALIGGFVSWDLA